LQRGLNEVEEQLAAAPSTPLSPITTTPFKWSPTASWPAFLGSRCASDAQQLAEFLNDLRFILGIIEVLNLNTRIWSKS
jgi:hypothetical protein